MKKKLAKLTLSIIVILLVAKILVSVAAYRMATAVQEDHRDSAAIDFNSFGTSLFSGTVTFNDVRFRPFRLKREALISELQVEYGGVFGLVSSMVASLLGDHYTFDALRGVETRTSFPDESFYDVLQVESGLAPEIWVGWLSCDGRNLVPSEQLQKMGATEFVFDWTVSNTRGSQWSAMLESQVFGRYELLGNLNLMGKSNRDEAMFAWLDLERFSMVDNGLFKRQLHSCYANNDVSLELFSDAVVEAWASLLQEKSYRLNAQTLELLAQYMQLGGVLTLNIQDKSSSGSAEEGGFGWQEVQLDKSYVLNVNKNLASRVRVEHFIPEPVPEPEPVVVEARPPAFVASDLEDLDLAVNQLVRVTLEDNKSYEGRLLSVEQFQFEIEPVDAQGKISYNLDRRKLVELEVWK